MVQFFDRTEYPLKPTSGGRDCYYRLRSEIRRLRRMSPTHYDVSWFATSLGLTQYSTAVTERHYQYGRVYAIGMSKPSHRLP